MSFIVLGTDTEAGKTTFSLLWLQAFGGSWSYWKPLETGVSDSQSVRRLVPGSSVHEPLLYYEEAVAPLFAARHLGLTIPAARDLIAKMPDRHPLLIETFGSPFSPLNEHELQLELIRCCALPGILVTASRVGAIGRSLSMLAALQAHKVFPCAIVLLGEKDEEAAEELARRGTVPVFSVPMPTAWEQPAIHQAAVQARPQLNAIAALIPKQSPVQGEVQDRSQSWLEQDRTIVWHPYTALQPQDQPLAIVAAQDEFLHLADGSRIIDGISSWWTTLHGHRTPLLVRALEDALQRLDHVLFAGATHPYACRVADLLAAGVPYARARVFFSDNGSTAVEVALKMAYQFWHLRGESQRTLFVSFEHGYHGDTFGAMAVSRDPLFFGRFEPLLFQIIQSRVDANQLESLLQQHRGKVAAAIIEPMVQGAGGMRMHTAAMLRDIAQVCERHGILLIADEVMTGCYRTGRQWAFQHAGITPDLICTSKTLAGGILPLAATIVAPQLATEFMAAEPGQLFYHGHSFTAQPLACAVAAANLAWMAQSPPRAPQRFESFWQRKLLPLRDNPHVKDVRICGSIAAVEIESTGGYQAPVGRKLRSICLENGVMLRPLGNVLYAMPPFCTSEASLEQIAVAMNAAISGSR